MKTSDRISKRGLVRALEDTPTHSTPRQVPMISPLGSVRIPVEDPYEGIADEQIMEIAIPCGILMGNSGVEVADRLREKDQARAKEFCAAEVT